MWWDTGLYRGQRGYIPWVTPLLVPHHIYPRYIPCSPPQYVRSYMRWVYAVGNIRICGGVYMWWVTCGFADGEENTKTQTL